MSSNTQQHHKRQYMNKTTYRGPGPVNQEGLRSTRHVSSIARNVFANQAEIDQNRRSTIPQRRGRYATPEKNNSEKISRKRDHSPEKINTERTSRKRYHSPERNNTESIFQKRDLSLEKNNTDRIPRKRDHSPEKNNRFDFPQKRVRFVLPVIQDSNRPEIYPQMIDASSTVQTPTLPDEEDDEDDEFYEIEYETIDNQGIPIPIQISSSQDVIVLDSEEEESEDEQDLIIVDSDEDKSEEEIQDASEEESEDASEEESEDEQDLIIVDSDEDKSEGEIQDASEEESENEQDLIIVDSDGDKIEEEIQDASEDESATQSTDEGDTQYEDERIQHTQTVSIETEIKHTIIQSSNSQEETSSSSKNSAQENAPLQFDEFYRSKEDDTASNRLYEMGEPFSGYDPSNKYIKPEEVSFSDFTDQDIEMFEQQDAMEESFFGEDEASSTYDHQTYATTRVMFGYLDSGAESVVQDDSDKDVNIADQQYLADNVDTLTEAMIKEEDVSQYISVTETETKHTVIQSSNSQEETISSSKNSDHENAPLQFDECYCSKEDDTASSRLYKMGGLFSGYDFSNEYIKPEEISLLDYSDQDIKIFEKLCAKAESFFDEDVASSTYDHQMYDTTRVMFGHLDSGAEFVVKNDPDKDVDIVDQQYLANNVNTLTEAMIKEEDVSQYINVTKTESSVVYGSNNSIVYESNSSARAIIPVEDYCPLCCVTITNEEYDIKFSSTDNSDASVQVHEAVLDNEFTLLQSTETSKAVAEVVPSTLVPEDILPLMGNVEDNNESLTEQNQSAKSPPDETTIQIRQSLPFASHVSDLEADLKQAELDIESIINDAFSGFNNLFDGNTLLPPVSATRLTEDINSPLATNPHTISAVSPFETTLKTNIKEKAPSPSEQNTYKEAIEAMNVKMNDQSSDTQVAEYNIKKPIQDNYTVEYSPDTDHIMEEAESLVLSFFL